MIRKLAHTLKRCCIALLLVLMSVVPGLAGWTINTTVSNTQQLRAVWGYSASKILAAGNLGTILLYDGAGWKTVAGITQKNIFGVWWASDHDAFAVCDSGVLLRFDGAAWKTMDSGTTQRLREVWGTSGTDVFAVGENGTIIHYDGTAWKAMTSPTSLTLQSVWGTSGSDVYAVGGASGTGGTGSGIIIRYDGKQWTTMSDPSIARLQDVFGFKGKMIFAVGEYGAAYTLAPGSSTWQAASSITPNTLRDIWGSAATNVYAVGDYGTILHYDGTSWSQVYPAAASDLFGIWGSSAKSIWAVGRNGDILHYQDNSTNDNSTCPFLAAVSDDDDLRLLRAGRDAQRTTLAGLCCTALFYATAPETARIVQHDQSLQRLVAALVADNRLPLQALARRETARINKNSLQEALRILEALRAHGSPGLAVVCRGLRCGLERGWLLEILDVTVE